MKRKHTTQIANARQRIKDRDRAEQKKGFALGSSSDTRSDFEKIGSAGEELENAEADTLQSVEEAFNMKEKQASGSSLLKAFQIDPEKSEAEAGE